jgi:hypothetical protein
MLETLRIIAMLWLAFNLLIGGIATTLGIVRAMRRKRLIKETSIGRLMAAHFESVRKQSAPAHGDIARREESARRKDGTRLTISSA